MVANRELILLGDSTRDAKSRDSFFQGLDFDSGELGKLFSHISRANGQLMNPLQCSTWMAGGVMVRRLWNPGPIIFKTSHLQVTMALMTTLLQECKGAFATSLWTMLY